MTETILLPNDKDAEQGVLGTIIHDNDALHDIAGIITGDMFFLPAHREIYTAMVLLANDQRPIDEITLVDLLRSTGKLDGVRGPAYVAVLRDEVPAASSVRHYAAIVKEKWQARSMIALALDFTDKIRATETVKEHLGDFRQGFADLIHVGEEQGDATHISKAAADWIERKDKPSDTEFKTIYTHLPHLDFILGGIGTDRPTVIAARPGVGKTSLCLQIAMNNAEIQIPTLFLNLEMATDDIVTRIFAGKTGIDSEGLHTKFKSLSDSAMDKVSETFAAISGYPLWIHTPRRRMTKAMLDGVVLRAIAKHRIKLIVVDQLSKIGVEGKTEFEKQTARMKIISDIQKLTGIPLVLAAQLKRPQTGKEGLPTLDDLKGTGQIEEDAGVVLFLHDPADEPKRNDPHSIRLVVAKNGMGKTGECQPSPIFIPAQCRFEDKWEQTEFYVD